MNRQLPKPEPQKKVVRRLSVLALASLLAACTTMKTQVPDSDERTKITAGKLIPVVLRVKAEGGVPGKKLNALFAIARCESHERLQLVKTLPSANEDLRREGWVYLLLEPGTYQLYASMSPGGYISEDAKNFISPYEVTNAYGLPYVRWLRLEVPKEAKAIYAGDLTWHYRLLKDATMPGNRRWLFEGCDRGFDEVAARRAVEAVTGAPGPTINFRPELWSESGRAAAWNEVEQVELDALDLTSHGIDWKSRGVTAWTGISFKNGRMRSAKGAAPASWGASPGGAGAAFIMLYMLYLPVGTLAGAGTGAHDKATIDPQLQRWWSGLAERQPSLRLAAALRQAKQTERAAGFSLPEGPLVCRVAVLATDLVECGSNGRFCLELFARARWYRRDSGERVGERFYCATNQDAWEPTGPFVATSGRPYETEIFGQPTHAKEELGKDEIQTQLDDEFGQAILRVAAAINEGR